MDYKGGYRLNAEHMPTTGFVDIMGQAVMREFKAQTWRSILEVNHCTFIILRYVAEETYIYCKKYTLLQLWPAIHL